MNFSIMAAAQLVLVMIAFLPDGSTHAAELKIHRAQMFKKVVNCAGTKHMTGLKVEFEPPEGQLFLRVEGMLELAEDEKEVRGSKEIFFESNGQQFKPLTALRLASSFSSYGHLGFSLKCSSGIDMIFLVPADCAEGTLVMGQWKAKTKVTAPKDDKPPSIHDDIKFTVEKASYLDTTPEWHETISSPDKAIVTIKSLAGKTLSVDVTVEALKDKNMWAAEDGELIGDNFSITLPSHETFPGHCLFYPGSKYNLVRSKESLALGKPETVKVLFLAPPGIKEFFLSYRGELVKKIKVKK